MNWGKIRTDTALALASQGFYKLVGFAVLAMLTRYLTKDDMGAFFFAATLVSVGALLTELGTNTWLTREVSANSDGAVKSLGLVLSVRLRLSLIYFVAVNLFAWFFRNDIWTIVLLSSVYIILEELYKTLGGYFLGVRKIAYNVASGVTSRLLLVLLILLASRIGWDVRGIVSCYIAANAFMLGIALVLARAAAGPIRLFRDSEAILPLLRAALPLFMIQILAMIHFRIDSLMIGFMRSYSEVATYESAYRLLEASRFLILPVGMVFFPLFSEISAGNRWGEMRSIWSKTSAAASGMGIVIATAVVLGGAWLIPFVYGSQYDDAIRIVRILFISVPMIYALRVSSASAVAMGLEKRCVPLLLICVIINIVLNAFLIPLRGAEGAAWTTLFSETLLALWMVRLVASDLRRRIESRSAVAAGGAAR